LCSRHRRDDVLELRGDCFTALFFLLTTRGSSPPKIFPSDLKPSGWALTNLCSCWLLLFFLPTWLNSSGEPQLSAQPLDFHTELPDPAGTTFSSSFPPKVPVLPLVNLLSSVFFSGRTQSSGTAQKLEVPPFSRFFVIFHACFALFGMGFF